jgi:hypothetical protein
MKTNELNGDALHFAVAVAEGWEDFDEDDSGFTWHREKGSAWLTLATFRPSELWKQGGPIIEREGIEIKKGNPIYFPKGNENGDHFEPLWLAGKMHGTTPLIAAMRCYVASKLGDDVDIPSGVA